MLQPTLCCFVENRLTIEKGDAIFGESIEVLCQRPVDARRGGEDAGEEEEREREGEHLCVEGLVSCYVLKTESAGCLTPPEIETPHWSVS